MKKLQAFFARHKPFAAVFLFLSFAIFGGCIFPVYNLTRPESNFSPWIHLYLAASLFAAWGNLATAMVPKATLLAVLALNLGVTLGGMGLRYLLEWGEVSNTYNFTLPNSLLHIAAAVTVSTLSWIWTKYNKK